MAKQPETPTYETAWAELQQILRELQDEAVGIDQLAAKIERANALIQFCRERLRNVETEVSKLTEGG